MYPRNVAGISMLFAYRNMTIPATNITSAPPSVTCHSFIRRTDAFYSMRFIFIFFAVFVCRLLWWTWARLEQVVFSRSFIVFLLTMVSPCLDFRRRLKKSEYPAIVTKLLLEWLLHKCVLFVSLNQSNPRKLTILLREVSIHIYSCLMLQQFII